MSPALKSRSPDLLYVSRPDPGSALPELADVVVVADASDENGKPLPVGLIGTVVAVLGGGEAYVVEFAEPEPTLATLDAAAVRPV